MPFAKSLKVILSSFKFIFIFNDCPAHFHAESTKGNLLAYVETCLEGRRERKFNNHRRESIAFHAGVVADMRIKSQTVVKLYIAFLSCNFLVILVEYFHLLTLTKVCKQIKIRITGFLRRVTFFV